MNPIPKLGVVAAGPGPEMERILASIEGELGWQRIGGGTCGAQTFVVD